MLFVRQIFVILQPLKSRGRLSIAAMVFLAAVLAGPFDTLTRLTLSERFVFWGGVVFFSLVTAAIVSAMNRSFVRGLPHWQVTLAHSVAMTVIFSPIVYGWTHLHVPPRGDSLMGFHWFVLYVALISVIIFHARGLIERARMGNEFRYSEAGSLPARDQANDKAAPRIFRRIDADDPGPIIRMEALDHFVTVVTAKDQYSLRLRFADAVDEADGVEGLITHRSHWIALAGVVGHKREKGRLFLHMSCGAYVPVSRKYFPDVEAQVLNAPNSAGHRDSQSGFSGQHSDGILPH
jgi:hypothetical protein